jgi:glycosyltransferase involved in cell wall biosynthesis
VGRVANADLVALYNASLALTLVSLDEGFGLPAIEAMACGVPVIASRVGALPEVVGDAGVYVDPRDPESIAEQLRRVAEDHGLRQELASRGLRRAARYHWSEVAARTAQAYLEAAACAF